MRDESDVFAPSAATLSVAAVVLVLAPILAPGCGSEPTEFDTIANYTPDVLAQELVLRYQALSPPARSSQRGTRKNTGPNLSNVSRKGAVAKKKESGPTTIDQVLEDIESKITLIKGSTPAETTKKMIETISSDKALPDADKKVLIEHVGKMGQ